MLIASFVIAVWCTIFETALLAGIFRGLVQDKDSRQLLGTAIIFLLMVPSIVGVALGLSSRDRRLPNSIAMWIATVWNGAIVGVFVLRIIIANLERGGR